MSARVRASISVCSLGCQFNTIGSYNNVGGTITMKVIGRLDKIKCDAFACPAVLEDENGDIIVIGTDVTEKIENLVDFNAGCASNEKIVKIPRKVWESITK